MCVLSPIYLFLNGVNYKNGEKELEKESLIKKYEVSLILFGHSLTHRISPPAFRKTTAPTGFYPL